MSIADEIYRRTVAEAHRQGMLGLLGCPGLLSRSAMPVAQRFHDSEVFTRHGLIHDEPLMGREWCVRYVNARRAVERAIDAAVKEVGGPLRGFPPTLPPVKPLR